jgi:hypothetical protein
VSVRGIVVQAEAALEGEPLRFICYGAALVVWLVVIAAHAIGATQLGPTLSLNDALIDATAAAALLTELCRRYVSPAG